MYKNDVCMQLSVGAPKHKKLLHDRHVERSRNVSGVAKPAFEKKRQIPKRVRDK